MKQDITLEHEELKIDKYSVIATNYEQIQARLNRVLKSIYNTTQALNMLGSSFNYPNFGLEQIAVLL